MAMRGGKEVVGWKRGDQSRDWDWWWSRPENAWGGERGGDKENGDDDDDGDDDNGDDDDDDDGDGDEEEGRKEGRIGEKMETEKES
jgi:hypothetical protein